ncbi:hypothetical protein AU476_36755 [Cupriavidus sp. UYMSc13B]|nr:hypothetical protein AU476_36755 [Cupriavidus sp. UYMSc13B]
MLNSNYQLSETHKAVSKDISKPLSFTKIIRAQAGQDGCTALQREALIYKYYWSNWHRDLGQLALDVLGPLANVLDAGDTRRTRLQQMALFSRADTIYAGTNEIQLNIIAERGLGMPREARGQS